MAEALWPAPGSSLTGPIGRQRRYTWARASLDDIKTIKRELGGTVNDVFLTVISGSITAGGRAEPILSRRRRCLGRRSVIGIR